LGFVRITVSHRVRGRIRDRVRFRDRDHRSEPDRRSEAINFGANSDCRSEPNTVHMKMRNENANLNMCIEIKPAAESEGNVQWEGKLSKQSVTNDDCDCLLRINLVCLCVVCIWPVLFSLTRKNCM